MQSEIPYWHGLWYNTPQKWYAYKLVFNVVEERLGVCLHESNFDAAINITTSHASSLINIRGGVLFLTQAWVLLKWKSTQLDIFILW